MNTAQVTQLTYCVDLALIARLFARFRGRYGNLWTSRATCDEDWEFIMDDWLSELSKFSLEQVRTAVNKTLAEYVSFPPTLGQLVELCMKESGVPEPHDVIRLMVARDFSHPLVKMIYDKIGSWTLSNGKSEEIERKVKEHYQAMRSEFYVDPQKSWAQLEEYNAKPKELPPPSKIPSTGESEAFRECMNKCGEILQGKKITTGGKTHKEFDANKIDPRHREFDRAIFEDYKAYLMSIPETETMTLPPVYVLDRNKFLNMQEQPEYLRKAGYIPPSQRAPNESPKSSDRNKGSNTAYKSWMKEWS
jgi:hypothetical protein